MPTEIDFIGGNTKHCLMAMALPMIAAMFLNMAYNLVDSLWIGNLLGKTAYAALTNSTPIILILTSIAMGAANGVSILLSQAIGAKDKKKGSDYHSHYKRKPTRKEADTDCLRKTVSGKGIQENHTGGNH